MTVFLPGRSVRRGGPSPGSVPASPRPPSVRQTPRMVAGSRALSLSAIVASYVVLLWIVASAASRGRGFLFFAVGLALLAVALLAFAAGRRSLLYGLFFANLLAAVTALGFEAALRLAPGILQGPIANVAYTGYHWHRGGV